jgi:hypothetical protein
MNLVQPLATPLVQPLVLGLSLGVGGGLFPNPFLLWKKRSDGSFFEFLVYDPMPGSEIEWRRWLFTNRFNVGNAGPPRMIRCSLAKLYASTTTSAHAENLTTGTQAQSATETQGTAGGSRVGTYVGPATVNSVTDIIYSVTIGDVTTYTVTSARRIVWRTLCNASNGGIAAITVKAAGVEIDAAYYTIPLVSGERRIDCANGTTGQKFITLADDLPDGTYTVEIAVSAANGASKRVYDGGVRTFGLTAYNSVGRLGTFENRTVGATANVPTALESGAVAIYAFTGTRVAWRWGRSTNVCQVDVRVFDSGGTEVNSSYYTSNVTSNEVDPYSGTTAVGSVVIAEGLPAGSYYLKLEGKPEKNASSSGYRMYDFGVIAYDESTPGVLGVDAFDDQGVSESNTSEGVEQTLIGTGNLEIAHQVYKSTSAIGTANFVGGTHGFETTPADLVMKVDNQTIDYAGAADEATWIGARTWNVTCSTALQFPEDSSEYADVTYDLTIDRQGYTSEVGVEYTVATAKIIEDYAMMLNVPNTDTDSAGVMGGFAFFGDEVDDPDVQTFDAFDNSITDQPAQMSRFVFYNAGYAVTADQLNQGQINTAFNDAAYNGTRAMSFVQDRDDAAVKAYNRAFSGVNDGVVMPNGFSYSHRQRYSVRKL